MFIPQFKQLKSKFPGFDAAQLIFKYEKLESLCLELNKKIAELEESLATAESRTQSLKFNYDTSVDELMLKDTNRNKQMKMYLERLKEKEIEIKDAEEYRQNYMLLQRKILTIFIAWNSKIKVNGHRHSPPSNPPQLHLPLGVLTGETRRWRTASWYQRSRGDPRYHGEGDEDFNSRKTAGIS